MTLLHYISKLKELTVDLLSCWTWTVNSPNSSLFGFLYYLTSSFTAMIITTTTRGRHLTANMGCNKLLVWLYFLRRRGSVFFFSFFLTGQWTSFPFFLFFVCHHERAGKTVQIINLIGLYPEDVKTCSALTEQWTSVAWAEIDGKVLTLLCAFT